MMNIVTFKLIWEKSIGPQSLAGMRVPCTIILRFKTEEAQMVQNVAVVTTNRDPAGTGRSTMNSAVMYTDETPVAHGEMQYSPIHVEQLMYACTKRIGRAKWCDMYLAHRPQKLAHKQF